jgi:glutaredoxin 3
MTKVIIYGSLLCPYCFVAKRTLKKLGVNYREIRINKSSLLMREMISKSGRFTAPQFFINDEYIGGYGDLVAQAKSGELLNNLVIE